MQSTNAGGGKAAKGSNPNPKPVKKKRANDIPKPKPGGGGKGFGARGKPKSDSLPTKACSAPSSMSLLLKLDEAELFLVSELFAEHRFLFSQFAFSKGLDKKERAGIIIPMLGEIPQDLEILHAENGTKGKYAPSKEACEATFLLFAELVARNPLSAIELKREMDKSPPDSEEGKAMHALLEAICTENGPLPMQMLGLPSSSSLDFTLRAYQGAFP
jgi:hypothetical protein